MVAGLEDECSHGSPGLVKEIAEGRPDSRTAGQPDHGTTDCGPCGLGTTPGNRAWRFALGALLVAPVLLLKVINLPLI